MTDHFGVLSIIPPLLAIFLAIRTKQVLFSLLLGILLGYIIISDWNVFKGSVETLNALVIVFQSEGNTRTVFFTFMIGALIRLMQHSGGVKGFISYIQKKLSSSKKPTRTIQLAAGLTGFFLFIESNISILTVGTAFRPLFARYGLAKEKLAYLADSSSAPSCIIFPLNAWGAYIMGLLLAFPYLDPFETLLLSIPFNFYPILTLLFVMYIAWSGKSFGPMKKFEEDKDDHITIDSEEKESAIEGKAYNMTIPLLIMVISMPLFLVHTGWSQSPDTMTFTDRIWSSISNGSGSSAVMYSVSLALLSAGVMYAFQKLISLESFFEQSLKGMGDMMIMAILMVLAFAVGGMCNELGTGKYVAEVTSQWLSPAFAPVILFITSCFVAFATGTSWGTFAIMISIAMPLAEGIGMNPFLALGAVLGGGVFGDHCSPISDTTLIASVASGSDHIDHVQTQLPYALITGSLATLGYLVVGFILH